MTTTGTTAQRCAVIAKLPISGTTVLVGALMLVFALLAISFAINWIFVSTPSEMHGFFTGYFVALAMIFGMLFVFCCFAEIRSIQNKDKP